MKFIFLFFSLIPFSFAAESLLKDAPLEWLAVEVIHEKIEQGYYRNSQDPLLKEIFETLEYDIEEDELVYTQNKSTNALRKKLINYVRAELEKKSDEIDLHWMQWDREGASPNQISFNTVKSAPNSFYFFNHVHTNISQDNASLKLLKLRPKTTFKYIERFLKKRNSKGAVVFTDHGTDEAYDMIKDRSRKILTPYRGVEWGGSTHMGLVGIKANWDLLKKGREFRHEESIIKSRTSGGFRIVNHPNRGKVFHHSSWLDADGAEVWNTILENTAISKLKFLKKLNNKKALRQWSDSLKAGKRHTALGGTDFHFIIPCLRDRTMHFPANIIQGSDPANLKELLKKGRSSFIVGPTVPKMTLFANFSGKDMTAQMGETLSGEGELNVQLFADFADTKKRMRSICYNTINAFSKLFSKKKKNFWELRFYDIEGKMIAKRRIDSKNYSPEKSLSANFSFKIKGRNLVRSELWEINPVKKTVNLVGATNPIYINANF